MRINVVVEPKDVKPAVDWIGGLIGAPLDKRVAAFKAQGEAGAWHTAADTEGSSRALRSIIAGNRLAGFAPWLPVRVLRADLT
jgi:hypothetical protein